MTELITPGCWRAQIACLMAPGKMASLVSHTFDAWSVNDKTTDHFRLLTCPDSLLAALSKINLLGLLQPEWYNKVNQQERDLSAKR